MPELLFLSANVFSLCAIAFLGICHQSSLTMSFFPVDLLFHVMTVAHLCWHKTDEFQVELIIILQLLLCLPSHFCTSATAEQFKDWKVPAILWYLFLFVFQMSCSPTDKSSALWCCQMHLLCRWPQPALARGALDMEVRAFSCESTSAHVQVSLPY